MHECQDLHSDGSRIVPNRWLSRFPVSRVFPDRESCLAAALELATRIATKSPVAVQGSKIQLNFARDHGVDESLRFHATWNAANLQGEDTMKAAMAAASRQKQPPVFSKL